MKRRSLLTIAAASVPAMAGCSGVAPVSETTPSPTPKPMTPFEASEHPEVDEVIRYELAIHNKTNKARQRLDMNPVEYKPQVSYISRRYSKIMAEANRFSHGVDGSTAASRLSEYGMYCGDTGENLSLPDMHNDKDELRSGSELAKLSVAGWLNSDEGHRENLLDDEWEYEGVGVYVTADAKVYVTQTFTARDCDGPGDPPRYDGEYDG
jgi:uncharacterized protein YkwD